MTVEEKLQASEEKVKQLEARLKTYEKLEERLSLLDGAAEKYMKRGRISSYGPLYIKIQELQAAGFNKKEIARMLDTDINKIYRAINKYGIKKDI